MQMFRLVFTLMATLLIQSQSHAQEFPPIDADGDGIADAQIWDNDGQGDFDNSWQPGGPGAQPDFPGGHVRPGRPDRPWRPMPPHRPGRPGGGWPGDDGGGWGPPGGGHGGRPGGGHRPRPPAFDSCQGTIQGTWGYKGGRPMTITLIPQGRGWVSVTVSTIRGGETLNGTCRPNGFDGSASVEFSGGVNNGSLYIDGFGRVNGVVAGFSFNGQK